jgi:hypothetical protein
MLENAGAYLGHHDFELTTRTDPSGAPRI